MNPFKAYVFGAGMMAVIGIAALVRGDLLAGILVLFIAVGCGWRASNERRRGDA